MSRKRTHAFTLVELLVVIGIIALLISILLPTLSSAREASMRAKCLANLRTLGQTMHLYSNDSDGEGMFGAYSLSPPPPGFTTYQQFWFAARVRDASGNRWDPELGYLTPYYVDSEFLNCPAANSIDYQNFVLLGTVPMTTYAYNNNARANALDRMSNLESSTDTFALHDALAITSSGGAQGVYASLPPTVNGAPTFHGRHRGNGNVLWYDGHAGMEKPYISTLPSNHNGSNGAPANVAARTNMLVGFLTPFDGAEADIQATKTTNLVDYYYWASKLNRR